MLSNLRINSKTARRGAGRCRPRGFTLFELVIVIAIVGAVAALVAPRITKLPQRAVPTVVSFLEAERSQAVTTGKATEIRVSGRTLISSASGARLDLADGVSIRPIHPVANGYLPGLKLTEFFADGTMRASVFRVITPMSAYTVELSPFAHRIRYARAL